MIKTHVYRPKKSFVYHQDVLHNLHEAAHGANE